jgi:competence protein ComEA
VTTSATGPDGPTSARLDALRAALAHPADDPEALDPAARPEPPQDDSDLAERLRSRRSAAHVAAAYSAAHGHPWAEDRQGRPRWSLAGTTAVAAAGVLLAVALVVVALAWPKGEVADLGATVSGAAAEQISGSEEAGAGSGDASAAGRHDEPADAGPAHDGPAHEGAASADLGGPAGAGDVVVHVVGQVESPGLVTLPVGSRVADAVEAAGGATGDAELAALNLARDVVDGEQVVVPAPGEVVAAPVTGTGGSTAPGGSDLVPLNTADAAALIELPGVGPVLAERILAWRDEHGPFTDVEELAEVSGIGPVVLDGLRDLVVV